MKSRRAEALGPGTICETSSSIVWTGMGPQAATGSGDRPLPSLEVRARAGQAGENPIGSGKGLRAASLTTQVSWGATALPSTRHGTHVLCALAKIVVFSHQSRESVNYE